MKIGLLTLHDSINYGALLQAYALSSVYRSLGHETVLIDRRRDRRGWALKWELSALSPLARLPWFLNATGIWAEWRRRRRSRAFLRGQIGLTPYHFAAWREAPRELGVDLLSVGSDQVWNAGIHDPLDYLPGRIPADVPAISYAASVGMKDVPEALKDPFRRALGGFRAVSVRDRGAVDALARLGATAAHVVDPVILAGRPVWDELVGRPAASGRVVVYLLGVYLPPIIEELVVRCERTGVEIDFFVGRLVVDPLTRRKHPRLFRNLKFWRSCRRSPKFHLHLDDGPESFVRAIAAAQAVVTSSYHALLFSVLYGKNVRFVVPDAATPQSGMMVRLADYVDEIVRGPLLQPSLSAAFDSLVRGETTAVDGDELARRRATSLDWLKGVL